MSALGRWASESAPPPVRVRPRRNRRWRGPGRVSAEHGVGGRHSALYRSTRYGAFDLAFELLVACSGLQRTDLPDGKGAIRRWECASATLPSAPGRRSSVG